MQQPTLQRCNEARGSLCLFLPCSVKTHLCTKPTDRRTNWRISTFSFVRLKSTHHKTTATAVQKITHCSYFNSISFSLTEHRAVRVLLPEYMDVSPPVCTARSVSSLAHSAHHLSPPVLQRWEGLHPNTLSVSVGLLV